MKPEYKKYYRDDGSIEEEYWYLNNEFHKTDGLLLFIIEKTAVLKKNIGI